jgi:hypothetical protein
MCVCRLSAVWTLQAEGHTQIHQQDAPQRHASPLHVYCICVYAPDRIKRQSTIILQSQSLAAASYMSEPLHFVQGVPVALYSLHHSGTSASCCNRHLVASKWPLNAAKQRDLAANKQTCLGLTMQTRLKQLCWGTSEPSGADALMPHIHTCRSGCRHWYVLAVWLSLFHIHACVEAREPAVDELSHHAGGVCTTD